MTEQKMSDRRSVIDHKKSLKTLINKVSRSQNLFFVFFCVRIYRKLEEPKSRIRTIRGISIKIEYNLVRSRYKKRF